MLKKMIKDYVNSPEGKKTLNRPDGNLWTGRTYKDDFYRLRGNKVVIERKDVRETAWRNTALAQALKGAIE